MIEKRPLWKSGMRYGIALALVVSFLLFVGMEVTIITTVWDSIQQTGGDTAGNTIGWIFIYGILPCVGAIIIGIVLSLILGAAGALLGWCMNAALERRMTQASSKKTPFLRPHQR